MSLPSKPMTRKEAAMARTDGFVPMTREEAILNGQEVKAFTREEEYEMSLLAAEEIEETILNPIGNEDDQINN